MVSNKPITLWLRQLERKKFSNVVFILRQYLKTWFFSLFNINLSEKFNKFKLNVVVNN
jgi:hypothetical protein